jgi:cell wall-associated NlpC family hydrolase
VFALAGTTAAFVGDAGIAEADLAQLDTIEGTLDFGAPVDRPTTAKIAAEAANFRSGPGLSYKTIGRLPSGTVVTIIEGSTDWYKVRTPAGSIGWISQKVLAVDTAAATKAAPAKATPAKPAVSSATTNNSSVSLRNGPGTKYAILGRLPNGSALNLLGKQGSWYKVQTAAGTTGWVAAGYVAVGSSGSAPAPAVPKNVPAAPKQQTAKSATQGSGERSIAGSSRGAIAARVALRYVGARYVWGGASPRGFDCSGLVLYAYRQAGLRLPHKARSQFSTRYGTRIRSIGALKTGDIVFFANTAGRGITHVAIYVGNGRMVTANSPRSGVLLQSIHTRYWRSHFAGAIRPHG